MQVYAFIILVFLLTHLDGIWRLTKRFGKFLLLPPLLAVLVCAQDSPLPSYAHEPPRPMLSAMVVEPPSRLERSIAELYAPVLEFHPRECFFPMDAEEFLNSSSLVRRGFIEIDGWDRQGAFLRAHANPDYSLRLLTRKLAADYCADFRNLTAEPVVYARIDEHAGFVFVQYWFLYYYNDIVARSVASIVDLARAFTRWVPDSNHQGDWELIQLVFPKDATVEQIAAEESAIRPAWVVYSQHGHSQRKDYSGEVHLEGLRPKVYVARGSHASSYEPVSCAMLLLEFPSWMQGFDRRAAVTALPGDEYQLKYITEHDWYTFPGQWGTISLLGQQAWTDPIRWGDGSPAHCLGFGQRTPVAQEALSKLGRRLIPDFTTKPRSLGNEVRNSLPDASPSR